MDDMTGQPFDPQIFQCYPFDPAQPATLLRQGIDNDVYVLTLTNGRQAILRISKRDVAATIDFEVKFVQHLAEQQAPVAHIIPTVQGALWQPLRQGTAVLFQFVAGRACAVAPEIKPATQIVQAAGEALGTVHRAGQLFTYTHPQRRTIFTEFDRALAQSSRLVKLTGGADFVAALQTYRQWAHTDQGAAGVLHNDYIPDNVLFADTSLVAVIDFDWACRGPLLKDLGLALAIWSLPDGLEQHWTAVFDAFLAGYNHSAPQKVVANAALYRWICFACLSDACTFFADLPVDSADITDVKQCRRYRKFVYFEKFLGLSGNSEA